MHLLFKLAPLLIWGAVFLALLLLVVLDHRKGKP